MNCVFLSYRRGDCPDAVGRVYERVAARLRNREVFYDHQSIDPGEEFPELLRKKVTGAGVVLVFIGPKWVEHLRARRAARVDHVREEVRLALASAATVVPVLVGNASLPTTADLAEFPDIQPLLGRNAQRVSPDPLFDAECRALIEYLERAGPAELVGGVLDGKYKVQRKIGEGGMGDVYAAEQSVPVRRTVAVKLVKLGMDTKEVLARFDAERQALAVMDHPNVCKVLDAGTAPNGRPYFVMELVKGEPITQFCDDRRLSTRDRLGLFVTVCNAVHHAHQKGIVHRDIKPGNVLVEDVEGRPVAKVIDFGLAKSLGPKLTDRTLVRTEYGRWVGTLEYSSPEQVEGRHEVGPASDVYSLGALLYELLTGVAPFSRSELGSSTEDEIKSLIRNTEPQRPSTKARSSASLRVVAEHRRTAAHALPKLLSGDLDGIVLNALNKTPASRYESAAKFAADVENYLEGRPVTARVPSRLRGVARTLRRNRAVMSAALAGAAGVALAYVAAADNDAGIPGGDAIRRSIDRNQASVFRPVPTEAEVRDRAAAVRGRCHDILRGRQAADGGYVRGPVKNAKPEWSVWTHNQAVAAVTRLDPSAAAGLRLPFDDRHWPVANRAGEPYGWLGYDKCPYTLAEPALWFHIAAAHALRPGGSTGDADWLGGRVDLIQTVLDRYYSSDGGGWNKFPDQTNAAENDPYSSVLGLTVLLELRAAGKGWHGDTGRRDHMLRSTARYLLAAYRPAAAVPGWSCSEGTNLSADGLTIQVYAVLLRAEAEADVKLPPPVLAAMRAHLADFKRRAANFPESTGQVIREFRDHTGTTRRVQESVNFLWYPWAVELTTRYLERLTRTGGPPDEVSEVRRIQARLVLGLSEEALGRAAEGNTFITSELLYCFSVLR